MVFKCDGYLYLTSTVTFLGSQEHGRNHLGQSPSITQRAGRTQAQGTGRCCLQAQAQQQVLGSAGGSFSPRNSCFTAVWALLRESLSSPSQDWERFLVPCPVGWHRTRFMLHGLSKPCRGVDGAFQGPEVQFLAQLFLLVVCKVHFPPAPAFVRVLRARQSLNSGKTSCLA